MAPKGKGKAAARGPSPAQNSQALEVQFQQRATQLFDSLMDWNQTNPGLLKSFGDVLSLRSRLMQAYQAQDALNRRHSPAPPAGGASADGAQVNWKGELCSEYARFLKKSPTKEDLIFEVADVEGGGFIASLVCAAQGWEFQGEEVAPSKKLAEHYAAKAALQQAFPDTYARLTGFSGRPGNAKVPQGGNKRKSPDSNMQQQAPQGGVPDPSAKSRIQQASTLLTGQCGKGDVVYECVAVEGDPEFEGQFVATVTLQAHDPSVGYQGLPATNKKLAESNAAEAALDALADQIAPLEEEHKAKKAKKAKESLESLRERTLAKKAAEKGAVQ